MKVWELMQELSKAPAGADVKVDLTATMQADCDGTFRSEDLFLIQGGDAEVIDSNGDSMGWLSSISEASDDSEDPE